MNLDFTENAWEMMLSIARKKINGDNLFYSPVDEHKYSIVDVNNRLISIRRQEGYNTAVGFIFFKSRLQEINAAGGVIARRAFSTGHVAKGAAIVFLHPLLRWSDDKNYVIIDVDNVYNEYKNGQNNAERQYAVREIRQGQGAFRENLIEVYQNRCCVTGIDIGDVLDAAHILPHNVGINYESTNGLLLRSDIHNLFDVRKLAIHPTTLEVHLHHDLVNTEYWQYNGIEIARRADGRRPSEEYLKIIWESKNW